MSIREVVRKTTIPCDACGTGFFQVEKPGSETESWLRCPNCGQYYYTVGNVVCACWIKDNKKALTREQIEKELGKQDLTQETKDNINAMRAQIKDWGHAISTTPSKVS